MLFQKESSRQQVIDDGDRARRSPFCWNVGLPERLPHWCFVKQQLLSFRRSLIAAVGKRLYMKATHDSKGSNIQFARVSP